jgi:hypothetical protein
MALGILGYQTYRYGSYWQDDAFISFAYAKNLLALGRLVYRPDEVVEGYTNFLWTVLSAGAIAVFGRPPVLVVMKAVSLVAAAGLVGVVALANRTRCRAWVHLASPVALAASTALAFHVNSGLETAAFSLAIAGGFWLLRDALDEGAKPLPGLLCFLAAALLRFDGFMPLGIAAAATLVSLRRERRRELRAVLLVGGLYAVYFLWRAWYYDSLWPNTVIAKLSANYPASVRLTAGFWYLIRGVHGLGLYWLLPGVFIWILRRRKTWGELLGAALIAWFSFQSVSVGGDAMMGFRFLFPAVPIAIIQGLAGYDDLLGPSPGRRRRVFLTAPALLFAAWAQWVVPITNVGEQQIKESRGVRRVVANFYRLATAFAPNCRPEDEVATDVAGVFAYLTDCRVLDTWGLASREVSRRGRARNPTYFESYGVVAPEVVLERRPRFILPFPSLGSTALRSRRLVLAAVFPEGFFPGKPEMLEYELKTLVEEPPVFQYFERTELGARQPQGPRSHPASN